MGATSAYLAMGTTETCCCRRGNEAHASLLPEEINPPEGVWQSPELRFAGQRVVVVLEKASVEAADVIQPGEVMSREAGELATLHECLLALMGSALNLAGLLLVYVHTREDVLVEVHPSLQVPQLFMDFVRLSKRLMADGQVAREGTACPVLRVVPTPVQQFFPARSCCYGLTPSGRAENLQNLADLADRPDEVCVFAIGASSGDPLMEEAIYGSEYAANKISITQDAVTAQELCQKVCRQFADSWSVDPKAVTPPPGNSVKGFRLSGSSPARSGLSSPTRSRPPSPPRNRELASTPPSPRNRLGSTPEESPRNRLGSTPEELPTPFAVPPAPLAA